MITPAVAALILNSLGFIKALHKGEEIEHKEVYKNTQSLMNMTLFSLWVVSQVFPGLGLDEGTENSIASGLVAIVTVYNTWCTNATSKNVGLGAIPVKSEEV